MNDAALILQDTNLLARTGQLDFIAEQVRYNHSCGKAYINKAKREQQSTFINVFDIYRQRLNKIWCTVLSWLIHYCFVTGMDGSHEFNSAVVQDMFLDIVSDPLKGTLLGIIIFCERWLFTLCFIDVFISTGMKEPCFPCYDIYPSNSGKDIGAI